jgi:hypothetical protein
MDSNYDSDGPGTTVDSWDELLSLRWMRADSDAGRLESRPTRSRADTYAGRLGREPNWTRADSDAGSLG